MNVQKGMTIQTCTVVKVEANSDCSAVEAQVQNDEVLYPPISAHNRMKPNVVRRHIHILQTLLAIAENNVANPAAAATLDPAKG